MLVSGGQILAIDKVNTGNTILGDGVQKPLGVNTDLIATTLGVSNVSAALEQQIVDVSGKFIDYYTKEETSGAQQIQDAFDNFKTTQTIVSAGSDTVDVTSAKLDEKTVVYTVKVASSEVDIAGTSGISAKQVGDTWILGLSADFLSANALEDYYNKNTIDGKFIDVSAWANETFVSASQLNDYYKKTETSSKDEIQTALNQKQNVSDMFTYAQSAWVNDNYLKKGDYLSANTLDNVSGKWESVYGTVTTVSSYWNKVSAYSATSGKFVTSAGVEFNPALAYFLKKDEETEAVGWSGVDLTNLGKMYDISSITPDLISAGISADENNNPIYVLSAAKREEISIPSIEGNGLSAWKDSDLNKYFVNANIAGNNGISADYDADSNTWNVGISANDYAYYSNTYENNNGESVDTDTIIKFIGGIAHNISVDANGYFTLPSNGNKFTICINETVSDNTDDNAHAYLSNKIKLCSKLASNDETVLVSTNNYYATEVGASDATIAYTLTNTPNTKYFIKYAGSKIDTTKNANAKLHIVISILEEVLSFANVEGSGSTYTAGENISIVDNVISVDGAYPLVAGSGISITTSGENYVIASTSTEDVMTITSEDDTIDVVSADQTHWDLSIKSTVDRVTQNEEDITSINQDITNIDGRVTQNETNITEIREEVQDVQEDISDLGDRITRAEAEITNVEEDIQVIDADLSNKKDKQNSVTFTGSATKTVKQITQNANGVVSAVFEDIALPPEVPNIEMVSPNKSITITSAIDAQTNVKTFSIDVNMEDVYGLLPGSGISITTSGENYVIASTVSDTTYSPGTGIDISNDVISINSAVAFKTDIDSAISDHNSDMLSHPLLLSAINARQAALPTSGTATDTYAINISGNAATASAATKLESGSVYCDNQYDNWYKIATFTQTNSKLNGSVGATIAVIQGDLALKLLGGTTEFGIYNFVESRDGTGTDWSRYNKRNEYVAIGELTGISFGIVPSIINSKLKIDVYVKSNASPQNHFTFTVLNSYGSGNDSQEKTVNVTLYNPVSTDGQTTVNGLLIASSRALYPTEIVSALPASPEDGVMYLIPET